MSETEITVRPEDAGVDQQADERGPSPEPVEQIVCSPQNSEADAADDPGQENESEVAGQVAETVEGSSSTSADSEAAQSADVNGVDAAAAEVDASTSVAGEISEQSGDPEVESEQQAESATVDTPPPALDEISSEQLLPGIQPEAASPEDDIRVKAVLEAVVYVTEEPVTLAQIAAGIGQPEEKVRKLLDELISEYNAPGHGLMIRELAGGFKMTTKAEHHEAIRDFVRSLKPQLKLSLAALETLATIAYKQPVTAPEIMEIRGVQGAGVLKTLLDRKLITTAGRKSVVGKPILYKTTKEFLVQFGLKDLAELPSLKEFEELRRLALSEPEPAEAPERGEPGPVTPASDSKDEIETTSPARGGEGATESVEASAPASQQALDEPPGTSPDPVSEASEDIVDAVTDSTEPAADEPAPATPGAQAESTPESEQDQDTNA